MLISEILTKNPTIGSYHYEVLRTQCDEFLIQSHGDPLYKALPVTYNDFHRVKVRQQKSKDLISEAFNNAFKTEFYNIRQRAVFSLPTIPQVDENTESFFIFPTNGFKFLYSKEVKNSSGDYQEVINTLVEQFDDPSTAIDLLTDIVKYTYTQDSLTEAISSNSEIILYGIPSYYAIKCSAVPSYNHIIKYIKI